MKKKERRELKKSMAVRTKPDQARAEAAYERVSLRVTRWKVMLLIAVIALASFAAYFNSLKGDFIWDDEYLITLNTQIKSFSHIGDVFKNYVGYGSGNVNNFYRPLQELTDMTDYFLWGEHPFGFHLTNVLLHAAAAVAAFFFVFYCTGSMTASFFSGLFFGVHPINSEAVSYIAGRADPLYALFFFMSLAFYIRFVNRSIKARKTGFLYQFSLAAFILALLSKELAFILPFVVIAYLFVYIKGRVSPYLFGYLLKTWAGFAGVLAGYGILRATVLNFQQVAPPSVFAQVPLLWRLITFFKTIMVYLGLMISPHDLHMERRIGISRSLAEPMACFAVIAVALILWWAWRMRRQNRHVTFFVLWFFILLLPVSNIVPINSLIAEHWVYTAEIGCFAVFFLYVEKIMDRLPGKAAKALLLAPLLCAALVYMGITIVRNNDWKDEITFFNASLKYNQGNAKLHLNLGNTYYEKGMFDKALQEYQTTIKLQNNYHEAFGNIGAIYLNKRDFPKAIEYLNKAIAIKKDFPMAHYNLGYAYYLMGDYAKAKAELSAAVQLFPTLYAAHNIMTGIYIKEKDIKSAREHARASLEINPAQDEIRELLKKL